MSCNLIETLSMFYLVSTNCEEYCFHLPILYSNQSAVNREQVVTGEQRTLASELKEHTQPDMLFINFETRITTVRNLYGL